MSDTYYHETLDTELVAKLFPLLNELKRQAIGIAGEWNGDDSGTLEDRATTASYLTDVIDEVKDCMDDLLG